MENKQDQVVAQEGQEAPEMEKEVQEVSQASTDEIVQSKKYRKRAQLAEKKLEELERPELTADSEMLIGSTIEKIEMGWRRSRGRKFAQYSSRSYAKMSSSEYWSVEESYSPSFKQLNDDEL